MRAFLLAALAVCLLPSAALAADTVTVPVGDWLVAAVEVVVPIVVTVIGVIWTYVVVPRLPAWLKAVYDEKTQHQFNMVADRAVQSGVAQIEKAALGKTLDIPVANEVLRTAIQYALDQAPGLVAKVTDDNLDRLGKMLLARMSQYGLVPEDFAWKDVWIEL